MLRHSLAGVFAIALAVSACAQTETTQPQQRGPRKVERLAGTITAIKDTTLTIEDEQHQATTVVTSEDTRVMKDGAPAKFSDLKAGDKVNVFGERKDEHTLTARAVILGQMPRGGGMMGMFRGPLTPEQKEQLKQFGLGTTFVVGRVKSIDETNITVTRVDDETQTVTVDENTSFKNMQGESATLADIKPGDRIMTRGALKKGTFLAEVVGFGTPPADQTAQQPPQPPAKDTNTTTPPPAPKNP